MAFQLLQKQGHLLFIQSFLGFRYLYLNLLRIQVVTLEDIPEPGKKVVVKQGDP